ncbi:MAG: LLM class flavin-dependent oxidoreductase [Proteobacteria bacterium]|nr:LLM class flavin-dependent oxidoreductase [Pseudomonadota bacterium]
MAKRYLEIGIFGLNASSGVAMTKVPERWSGAWEDVAKVARYADEAGYDFLLPIGRWCGYGGETNPTGAAYETFSFAACLSGLTNRIQLYSTVHVPFIHPTYAARSAATIDQASGGRFNLNIVCGWSMDEFQMFGLADYDAKDRYIQGPEWVDVFDLMMTSDEPFDYKGQHYTVQGGICLPKAVQKPRPRLMSATFSPDGRAFAAARCDVLFTMYSKVDISRRQNAELLEKAKESGKAESVVYTAAHAVVRDTHAEAESYYDLYADTMADKAAAQGFVDKLGADSPKIRALQQAQLKRIAGGAGTFPLIGSVDEVVQQLIDVYEAGFGGIGLSFVDYANEVPYFAEKVMPQLRKAGILKPV